MGEGHAWNAVKLDGRWYLIDTTWDAGGVDAEGFHKQYRTRYYEVTLFASTERFGSHQGVGSLSVHNR